MTNKRLKHMLTVHAFDLLLEHQRIQIKLLVTQVSGLTDLSMPSHRLLDNLNTFQRQLANRKANLEGTMELLKEAREQFPS